MIAAGVDQQGAAAQEIACNVQEAAQGAQVITTKILGVNQAAAGEVLTAAGELGVQAERLRADIYDFLAKIRAA